MRKAFTILMLLASSVAMAQNKVVVIPMAGDLLTVKDGKPDSNYIVGTDTVFDKTTGLEWQRKDGHNGIEQRDWPTAETYCVDLSLDEKDDWRLPQISELITLVNYESSSAINTIAFPSAHDFRYWSATSLVTSSDGMWLADFGLGEIKIDSKTADNHVRCVR